MAFNLTFIDNRFPVADARGPYTIAEGQSLTLAGTATDPDGDTLTYSWDVNNDGTFGDMTGAAPTLSWAQLRSFGIDDDGSHTVRLQVSDGRGGIVTDTATIAVTNIAPTLSGQAITSPIDENDSATLSGTIADPGTDSFTLRVDWGDGTGVQTYNLAAGTTTFNVQHQYLDDGTYPVTIVSLTDDDGGSAGVTQGGSIFLTGHDILSHGTQNNFDDVILDYLRGVGTSGAIARESYDIGVTHFSGSTPGGTGFPGARYATSADLASQAAFAAFLGSIDVLVIPENANVALLDAYSDAIESFFNAGGDLFIDSSNGQTGYYRFLPPGVAADGPAIGDSINFSATAAGAAIGIQANMINGFPTHNSFTSFNPVFTVLEVYRGSQVVSIGARNVVISNGSLGSALQVVVNNVDPTATLGNGGAVNEGSAGSVSFTSQSDVSPVDAAAGFRYSYDFDNDGTFEIVDSTSATAVVAASYLADGPGSRTVRGRIKDKDGGFTDYLTAITVNNVAPTITAVTQSGPVNEGSPVTVTVAAADPAGANDPLTYHFDFDNDGTFEVSNSTGVAQHVYADDGIYLVGVKVTDGDGGVAILSGAQVGTVTVTQSDFEDFTSTFAPLANVGRITIANPAAFAHSHIGSVDFAVEVRNAATGVWETVWSTTLTGSDTRHYFGSFDVSFSPRTIDGFRLSSNPDQFNSFHGWFGTQVGIHSQSVQVTVNNVAPTPSIHGAPASSPEGTAISLTSSVSDPGTLDTHTYAWSVTKNGNAYDNGTGSGFSFTPNDNGTYVVTLTVTDDDGGVDTDTKTITVTNVAPQDVNAGADRIVNEGDSVSLTGSFSDPGSADTHTLVWSVVASNGQVIADGNGSTFNFVPNDNGTYTVTFTVTDDDGAATSDEVLVTVNNVRPTVSLLTLSSTTVNEDGSVTVSGTLTDPSAVDTHSVSINWGDGSAAELVAVDAVTRTFTATHRYLDDDPTGTASDSYTISVTARDDDGGVSDPATASVTVNNVAPTVLTVNAPVINENGTAIVTGSFSDVGTLDTHTVTIDWGDGTTSAATVDAANRTFTASHQYLDDNPTATSSDVYTIGVTLTDDDGGIATAATTVTVDNVAPVVATVNLSSPTIDENGVLTVSGTVSDVGTLDMHTVTISWGDGSAAELVAVDAVTRTFTATHRYLDDDPTATSSDSYTIAVSAKDDDGGMSATATASVTVDNVAPVVAAVNLSSAAIFEHGFLTVTGTVTDVGTLDTHTVTIDFGDGTASVVVAVDAVTRTFTATHQYLDDNPTVSSSDQYTIRVTATDDDGGVSAAATAVVTVSNVAPVVTGFYDAANGGTTVAGRQIDLGGLFTDVGTLDTHSASVDWGDGSGLQSLALTQAAGGGGSIAGSHVFTAIGTYTVTVTVTDDDSGTSAVYTTDIDVRSAALLGDPCDPSKQALYVGGTLGADKIRVTPVGTTGAVNVEINGVSQGSFTPDERIVIYGQAGDDDLQAAGSIDYDMWLYGGLGDDRLKGGNGNDVLLGEEGDDMLVGGSGRDLLVGGDGADRIVGNSDDDILIAGSLNFGGIRETEHALCHIMDEWTSTRSYQERIANLTNALSATEDRLNGDTFLISGETVADDESSDKLTGSSGEDWFFFNADSDDATDISRLESIFSESDLAFILS